MHIAFRNLSSAIIFCTHTLGITYITWHSSTCSPFKTCLTKPCTVLHIDITYLITFVWCLWMSSCTMSLGGHHILNKKHREVSGLFFVLFFFRPTTNPGCLCLFCIQQMIWGCFFFFLKEISHSAGRVVFLFPVCTVFVYLLFLLFNSDFTVYIFIGFHHFISSVLFWGSCGDLLFDREQMWILISSLLYLYVNYLVISKRCFICFYFISVFQCFDILKFLFSFIFI